MVQEAIRLANELKMPIVIHSREADQEVMDILKEEGAFSAERKSWFPARPDTTGYVTGEKGSAAESKGVCDDARVLLPLFFGQRGAGQAVREAGGDAFHSWPRDRIKTTGRTVAVVSEIPLDFLLVETDSPYLTPEPFRGKKNDPSKVRYTAEKVAEIKGLDTEKVAAATKANAMRFYGIK